MQWLAHPLYMPEFKSRTGHGMFSVKNLVLNIGDCVSLVTRIITFMSVPSHLIGDVKEPLRTICTLPVTTLSASI